MSRAYQTGLGLVIFKTLWLSSLVVMFVLMAAALPRAEPADPQSDGRDVLRAEALAGDGASQFRLGETLLNDPANLDDLLDAYAWFVLADRNGHARARYYKRGMENVLDEQQQDQVAKRVAELTAAMEQGRVPNPASDSKVAAADAAPAPEDDAEQTESGDGPTDAESRSAGSPEEPKSADLQEAPGAADAAAASAADTDGPAEQGAEPATGPVAADEKTVPPTDDGDGAEDQRAEPTAPDEAETPASGDNDSAGGPASAAAIEADQPRAEEPTMEPPSAMEESRRGADDAEPRDQPSSSVDGRVEEEARREHEAPDAAEDRRDIQEPATPPDEAAPAAPPVEAAPATPPVEAAPAAPPVEAAPAAVAAFDPGPLIVRGRALLAQGDIVSARALFELAADNGSGEAALLTGKTYDPRFVADHKAVGLRGDAEQARRWYRTAISMGATEAQAALDGLSP
ncbi:MAG: hypothetical protein IPM60_07720 [Rhodospirillales bacterium]|nr:hypothetical protein [Rhodospirillales bacterium]